MFCEGAWVPWGKQTGSKGRPVGCMEWLGTGGFGYMVASCGGAAHRALICNVGYHTSSS